MAENKTVYKKSNKKKYNKETFLYQNIKYMSNDSFHVAADRQKLTFVYSIYKQA